MYRELVHRNSCCTLCASKCSEQSACWTARDRQYHRYSVHGIQPLTHIPSLFNPLHIIAMHFHMIPFYNWMRWHTHVYSLFNNADRPRGLWFFSLSPLISNQSTRYSVSWCAGWLANVMRSPPARRSRKLNHYWLMFGSSYEGWNFNSGNYLFTTDTK